MPHLDGARQVIVEGKQINSSSLNPFGDLVLSIKVVNLLAQMKPVIDKRLGPESFKSSQESARRLRAAKSRLP